MPRDDELVMNLRFDPDGLALLEKIAASLEDLEGRLAAVEARHRAEDEKRARLERDWNEALLSPGVRIEPLPAPVSSADGALECPKDAEGRYVDCAMGPFRLGATGQAAEVAQKIAALPPVGGPPPLVYEHGYRMTFDPPLVRMAGDKMQPGPGEVQPVKKVTCGLCAFVFFIPAGANTATCPKCGRELKTPERRGTK
jgi:hypothetical protein